MIFNLIFMARELLPAPVTKCLESGREQRI